MYFGYMLVRDSLNGDKMELALLSERQGSLPVPVLSLPYTEAAICFLSQEEAILVKPSEESSLTMSAQKPAKIYLTPNRPEKPGFSVNKIKISKNSEGKLKCHYDRDKGWEEFIPNMKDY